MGKNKKAKIGKPAAAKNEPAQKNKKTVYEAIREWSDPLIIAFILAMFIRTFVVELFKIPSGSMTPTLIGDYIAEYDFDNDGDDDLVVWNKWQEGKNWLQVFFRENGKYIKSKVYPPGYVNIDPRSFHLREDKILVNKFAYWFTPPKRGDIAVFKVPKKSDPSIDPWEPDKPVYIKRVIGLPDEEVGIYNGHIYINGKPLNNIPQIKDNEYTNAFSYTKERVPDGQIFMFGDNSSNSSDSRRWGGVPLENFKGKAIFRYWPLKNIGFLK